MILSDYEKVKAAIRGPWASLFMDGRNEHGTHFLPVPPFGLELADDEADNLLDSHDGEVERIFSDAERAGYVVGCCIIVACRVIVDDGGHYYEIAEIDEDLTRLIHGSAEEQVAEIDRLMAERVKA